MNIRLVGVVLSAYLLAACGTSATPAATTVPVMAKETPTAALVKDATPTSDAMMAKETPTTAMMKDVTSTPDAMMAKETPTPAVEKKDDTAMMAPDWFKVALTDVRTGKSFTIADLKGKVVLVETMAVWCSNCLKQQKEVKVLHGTLGKRDDFVSLGLGIDPNEDSARLKAYIDKNGFDWMYASSPAELSRELGNTYTAQFLNPPSTPMLIIDRAGEVHPLPFGIKSAQSLLEALQPYLN